MLLGFIGLGADSFLISMLFCAVVLGNVIFWDSYKLYGAQGALSNATLQALLAKWYTSCLATVSIVAGPFGANALFRTTNSIVKQLPSNYTTLIASAHFSNTSGNCPLITWTDTTGGQCCLMWFGDGTLAVYRGSGNNTPGSATNRIVGPTAAIYAQNTFFYIQFKVTFHGSTGSVEVRVNSVTVLSATNVNTIITSNAFANGFNLGTGAFANNFQVANLIIQDTNASQGAALADFLAPSEVKQLATNGAGTYNQWSITGGDANAQTVLARTPPDPTKYIGDTVSGHKTSLAVGDLSAGPSVYCAMTRVSAAVGGVGSASFKTLLIDGGVEREGALITPGASDLFYADVWPTDNAGAGWDVTKINGCEIGAVIRP
jgi:hypothetical protein